MLELKTYKNYKEVCKALKEDIKTGKSKQIQLKNWERFFKYHKDGNKIVIQEIFDTPKEKEDKRKNNGGNTTSKFKDFDYILINLLTSKETITTIPQIVKDTKIVADRYFNYRDSTEYLAENLEMFKICVNDFYYFTKDKLRGLINSSLNRLQKQGYISYKNIYIIKYDKEDVRQADEIEENTIKEYEEYALMAFGLESKKELITSNLYKRYNKDLKHNLKTYSILGKDYEYHYNAIKITKLKDYTNNNVTIKDIQDILSISILESATKKQDKINKSVWGDAEEKYNIERQSKDYIENINKLIDYIIYKKEIKKDNNKDTDNLYFLAQNKDLDELM